MLPDRVSNPGPLTYESGTLPIALRGPAVRYGLKYCLKGQLNSKQPTNQLKSHWANCNQYSCKVFWGEGTKYVQTVQVT